MHTTIRRLFPLVAARDAAALAHVRWIIIGPRPRMLAIGLEPSPHSFRTRVKQSYDLSEM